MPSGISLARTNSTYAGVDIKMILGGEQLGSAQAISYAVQREKAPLNVLGKVDPIAFSRGKRGIAGTLVALLLEEHLLHQAFEATKWFVADNDEIRPNIADLDNAVAAEPLREVSAAPFSADNLSSNFTVAEAWMVDQLLPTDAVIVAGNEYGSAAQMRIFGIEFLNEGSGISVDDRTTETQHTFVARSLMPWRRTGIWGAAGQSLVNDKSFYPEGQ